MRSSAFLFITLLLVCTHQQETILSSDPSNTQIVSSLNQNVEIQASSSLPSSSSLSSSSLTSRMMMRPTPLVETNNMMKVPQCDLSFLNLKPFGPYAKWICPAIKCYPIGWTTTYHINIETDCPSKSAIIRISSSGTFMVFDQNGNTVGSGSPYPKENRFEVKLLCGKNTFKILVKNQIASPTSLIYEVIQDKKGCCACSNPNQIFNKKTCACECQAVSKCPPYKKFNFQTCKCECQAVSKCPPNQNFNFDTCQCECPKKICPTGWVQDPICKCVKQYCSPPFVPCKPGTNWDPYQCKCVPDKQCCPPEGGCPKGKTFNTKTCKCQCSQLPQRCLSPKEWDFDTCSCECLNRKVILCPVGSPFSNVTCQCVQECQPPQGGCPEGKTFNTKTCKCQCSQAPLKCILPKEWDVDTCSCECLSRKVVRCAFGYDNQLCQCKPECLPPAGGCIKPRGWNRVKCQCECPNNNCPADWVFDPQCKCVKQYCSPPFVPCKEGTKWDPYQCSCIPVKCLPPSSGCPEGKQWNYGTCNCQCLLSVFSCPDQKMWSDETCQCECSAPASGCPKGKQWNSDKCQCQCTAPALCKQPKTWNSDRCLCQCLPPKKGCPKGKSWNYNACQCKCSAVENSPSEEPVEMIKGGWLRHHC